MRKFLLIMMLLTGISIQSYAQLSSEFFTEFELKNNPFERKFVFDLGKRDKMQIEMSDISDLVYLLNIDSIVNSFINDIEPLKDSLQREVYSRTIEYSVDGPGQKRISIQKNAAAMSNFMLSNGELTLLKVVQDTIIINAVVPAIESNAKKKGQLHYFRICFFLNDLNELSRFKGKLNEKMERLYASYKSSWSLHNGVMQLKTQPDISAPSSRGKMRKSLFISVRPSVDVQNYKNYFIPSVSAGLAIVTDKNLLHKEYYWGSENHFTFTRINEETKINVNTFIVLGYGQAKINPYTHRSASLYPYISLGYLVKRRGNTFDKSTFKLGLGQFNLFGNYTKIEPSFYFTDLLRGLSPSLRITQHF